MYELFADFYVKSSDSQPKYSVLMGSYYPKTINEMEKLGFVEDTSSGYDDYVMEAEETDLQNFTQEGYISEMLDTLCCGDDFERILIHAREIEVIDDDGNYSPRARMVGDVLVTFSDSEPGTAVWFEDQTVKHHSNQGSVFQVPVRTVKRCLNASTLMEVMDKLWKMDKERHWTYKQLKHFFVSDVEEAICIIAGAFYGEKDLNGNPAILHALAVGMAGKDNNEKTVGFLHDMLEDCDWRAEDVRSRGFSDKVVDAVDILTHRKDEDTYEEYIDKIIRSGNPLAINVKINALKQNIKRDWKARHKRLARKHKRALVKLESGIKTIEK